MIDIKKYQELFQQKLFEEVDNIFPTNISKERDKALLLVTVINVKFKQILEEINNLGYPPAEN